MFHRNNAVQFRLAFGAAAKILNGSILKENFFPLLSVLPHRHTKLLPGVKSKLHIIKGDSYFYDPLYLFPVIQLHNMTHRGCAAPPSDGDAIGFDAIGHIRIVCPNLIPVAVSEKDIPFQHTPCPVRARHEVEYPFIHIGAVQCVTQFLSIQFKIFSVMLRIPGQHFVQKRDQTDFFSHNAPHRVGAEWRGVVLWSSFRLGGCLTGDSHLASKSASVIRSTQD